MSTQITYDNGNTKIEEKKSICFNRGRALFGDDVNDYNHAIYNNGSDTNGEGAWDGMYIESHKGLKIRTENDASNGKTIRLEVNKAEIISQLPFTASTLRLSPANPSVGAPSADLAGTLIYDEPSEGGSRIKVCMKNGIDDYIWKTIIMED